VTARRRARGTGGWLAVAGARPNFVKLAPLVAAARDAGIALPWVHTGQHRDPEMAGDLVAALGLPAPVGNLGAAEGPPARQAAAVVSGLAAVLERRRPSALVVVGDVTSTLAAAVAGVLAGVPVAHVEAGLRSFDRAMPEERNRALVDHASDVLYASEPAAVGNLRREGVSRDRVVLVGNVMADALRASMPAAGARAPREGGFVLATLHRAANVDDRARLSAWVDALVAVARERPVAFPVHPRTRARLARFRLAGRLARGGVEVRPPLGRLDFLGHLAVAGAVATDSGGVSLEASILGVPCLVLRATTEQPLTLSRGTCALVGEDPRALPRALARALVRRPRARPLPAVWDGRAAARIVSDLARRHPPGASRITT
jgi:UDP-N-acetylglucosamine 2-epimerase (non-hydrolysing)